jgi:hypothetical protein
MADKPHKLKNGRPYQRIFRMGAILSLLFSLLIVLVATQVSSLAVPLSILRLGSGVVFLVGVALSIVSMLLIVFPTRWSVSLLIVQVLTVAAFALGARERSRGDLEVNPLSNESTLNRVWLNSVDWHELFTEVDPKMGFRGLRNAEPRVHHRDFDVTYRLGPDGYRVMPVPKNVQAAPVIVFLGCSMTFGAGCANEEIFPWLLAEKAWPRCRVLNWSVSGWGTTQAAINVERALKLDPKPSLILYGFIGDHIKRNDRRDTWHKKNDYLVFNEEGEFESLVKRGEGTVPDSPELRAKEIRVTRAILSRMKENCDRRGVLFAVLYLDDKDPFGPDRCEQVLDVPGLRVIDFRQSFTEVFPNDFHLTPLGHGILARAIARDQTLVSASGLADLHQPTAFPDVFPHEQDFRPALATDESPEKHRRVEYESTDQSLLVKKIESHGAGELEISFGRVIPAMKRGQVALVSFRTLGATDRKLNVLLDQFSLGTRPMGRVYPFVGDQGLVRRFFPMERDLLYPRIRICCGGDDSPFEIRDFQVEIVDQLPVGYDWLEVFLPNSRGRFEIRQGDEGERIARVSDLRMDSPKNWTIQYQVVGLPVTAGRQYRVSCLFRSDRPKVIPVALQKEPNSGVIISEFQGLRATEEWKRAELTFLTKSDAPSPVISFLLGEDTTPVEFQEVKMEAIEPTGD